MTSPLDLSVVIPTVNRPAFLRRAVLSCFADSVSPKEVIVVHDARSCVERYSQVYDELSLLPVRRLVHDARKGPSEARNSGWRAASSSWVYFLDDDDHVLPGGTEAIGRALHGRGPKTSVLAFGSRVHRAGTTHDELPGPVIQKYGAPFWAEIGTLVIERRCLDEVGGFDPAIALGENRDLMARLAACCRVEHFDEPIVSLDYAHADPRQSERAGTVEANVHLLRKNESIYKQDPLWWRSAHLYPACHAARRGRLGTSLGLYREWTRSSGTRLDARFLGAVASSTVLHWREVSRAKFRPPR